MIAFLLAAAVLASPPRQVVVTDREGRTYVGSTDEPDADPLVLVTPNGPMSIPKVDIASVSAFAVQSKLPLTCVCGCPTFGKVERAQEFFSILGGTSLVLSIRIGKGWFVEGEESFVSYDSSGDAPAAGMFAGYSWTLWDRRDRGGTSTWELPIEAGWRDEEVGDQPVRYRGIAGLTGVTYTRWLATRAGLRVQVLFGADQWIGPRPWFTDASGACDCPGRTTDTYEYRLARFFPEEYRVVVGLAF